MSKKLTNDELLDCAQILKLPEYAVYARMMEFIGEQLGELIAEKLNVEVGITDRQETAFAGTCTTFFPKFEGQDCPEPLTFYDEGEWN